jgi:uncharacterized membrane protein YqjE
MSPKDRSGRDGSASDERSTPEVIASLAVNAQALLAKEIELFGLELRGIVARKFAAIGLITIGALMTAGVLGLSAVTAAIALEDVFATRWHAWGVVTLAFLALALLLVITAMRLLASAWIPPRARRQASETTTWLRGLGRELTAGAPDAANAEHDGRVR